MKCKPSIAFDAMSGSAREVTAARTSSGTYLRNRSHGCASRTPQQAEVRRIFRQLSTSWRQLTAQQIMAWNTVAETQSGRHVLGQAARITGANLYQRLNFWVVRCGGTPLSTPPELKGVVAPPRASLTVTDTMVQLSVLDSVRQSGLKLVLMATAPQGRGITTSAGRGAIIYGPADPSAGNIDLTSDYTARYGAPSASRPQVFASLFLVNPATGERSSQISLKAVLIPRPTGKLALNLSADDNTHGTVSPAGTTYYDYDEVVSIQATPAEGYIFYRWSDYLSANPRNVTMRSDKTLQALFGEDRDFQVTTAVSPTGGGTVTGAGSYHFGEEACVVAEAADGYHFVQWNDGDTEPERYFDVTHDVELIATFESNSGE